MVQHWTKRNAQCPMCPHFPVSENHLEVVASCKTLTELKPCQPCCPRLSLLNKHAMAAFPSVCQLHYTGSWVGFTEQAPSPSTCCVYISTYTPGSEHKQSQNCFSPPPQQLTPSCISFRLSWAKTLPTTANSE